MQPALERIFRLSEKRTSAKTEILAGITTFMAMAYIIFVNPSILASTGMPHGAAVAATIWIAAICSIAMGLYANLPVAMAPGMGINVFFAYTVCGQMGLSWQTALGAVFISGVVFTILTVTRIRQYIIDTIPLGMKCAVAVGIGLFISFIGLRGAGLVVGDEATLLRMGNLTEPKVMLACLGMLVAAVLLAMRVRAAILVSILLVTVLGMVIGATPAPQGLGDVVSLEFPSIAETFMAMDLMGAVHYGLISVIFTFTIVELFDNLGTLIGVTKAAGLMDERGNIEHVDRALVTDSLGTMLSAVVGTSTVTCYIESTAGINAGGRTGLSTVVVGVCFVLALLLAPLAGLIPGFATAPALVIVGSFMMANVRYIDFSDYTESIPAFLTIMVMPLTNSIANGFGFGLVSYVLIKALTGRIRTISPVMWLITIAFCISFALN
ncbi:MAG: NCS2 family permease [Succinivibrionaceae bacterium]|nr:NCS2 family permease [Succinivibrionaceae bacterium]